MAVQPTNLFAPTLLTGSAATFYTVPSTPAGGVLYQGRGRFTNTDSASHAVTMYAIPSGGTASATTECLPAYSIAPTGYLDLDMPMLTAGGFYQAFADTPSKVSVTPLSGVLLS